MKILVILPIEEYFSPINGGALATWTMEVFRTMPHNVLIISPKSQRYFNGFKVVGLPVKCFEKIGKTIGGKLGHHLRYNLYVVLAALTARMLRYSTIHVHNRPTYVPIVKRLFPKAKVVLHMNNDHILYLNKKQTYKLNRSVDLIISVSRYIESNVLKQGIKYGVDFSTRSAVLFNGANSEIVNRIKQPVCNSNILFIGRVVPEKGIKQLVLAILAVKKIVPEVKLLIAGSSGFGLKEDDLFMKELKQLASKSPESFVFLGYVEHSKIGNLFEGISVYCIPSIWHDPCPLAVMEGMASGIPMIVGDKGGIPEQVGDTALCVDCEKPDQLSEAILYLLQNRERGSELAEKAYERFTNHFTWDKVRENYLNILNQQK